MGDIVSGVVVSDYRDQHRSKFQDSRRELHTHSAGPSRHVDLTSNHQSRYDMPRIGGIASSAS